MNESYIANIQWGIVQSILSSDEKIKINLLLYSISFIKVMINDKDSIEVVEDLEKKLYDILKTCNFKIYDNYIKNIYVIDDNVNQDIQKIHENIIQIDKIRSKILEICIKNKIDIVALSQPF
ncbi:hypothetical protein J3E07_001661 [Methanococcus voltae]|uniref:Uncharacterized protein n=1 Tax=Methanococcus voltae TaxID=2188 RepID=A0A8J7S2N9_METVO|nr:hypothetical protein [Methanococcus voltae]MBP2202220.1 hypothetical protein [Methanococcus voltae]